jgi:hypothetical protein
VFAHEDWGEVLMVLVWADGFATTTSLSYRFT